MIYALHCSGPMPYTHLTEPDLARNNTLWRRQRPARTSATR